MLKRLRLHNFRTFLNAEIEFGRRHLLIGKNNSGKSNLCFALRFLGRTASYPLLDAANATIPAGISEIKNSSFDSDRIDFSLECELMHENQPFNYRYELSLKLVESPATSPSGATPLRLDKERLLVDGGGFTDTCLLENDGHEAQMLHEDSIGSTDGPYRPKTLSPDNATMLSKLYELETNRRAIFFRKFLQGWMYFAFSPESIRLGWPEAWKTGGWWTDGSHVARAIFLLKNEDERRYRRLIERVQIVEPDLEAISFHAAMEPVKPSVVLKHRENASWIGLSDGTLRALALSLVIEASDRVCSFRGWPPPVTIVEEPENGIYGNFLRKLLEDFENCAPQAQFIFTSHSPFFIDLFDSDPGSVTVLRRDGATTRVKRPTLANAASPPAEQLTLSEKYFAEIME